MLVAFATLQNILDALYTRCSLAPVLGRREVEGCREISVREERRTSVAKLRLVFLRRPPQTQGFFDDDFRVLFRSEQLALRQEPNTSRGTKDAIQVLGTLARENGVRGAPHDARASRDVTLDELRIECAFPPDEATAEFCKEVAQERSAAQVLE